MSGTLTLGGMVAGLLSGEKVIGPLAMQGTSTIGQIQDLALATGANAVTVPTGAVAVVVAIPVSNAATLQIKTNLDVTGNGVSIGSQGFVVLPITSGVTSLTITSSGTGSTIELSFI